MSRFKKIFVFCGSSQGRRRAIKMLRLILLKNWVVKNIDLVYGEGSLGLMGLISQAMFDGGKTSSWV
ncbi:hypothetical protein DsansV1_C01g0006491 [Dioscorea sansibarensis]